MIIVRRSGTRRRHRVTALSLVIVMVILFSDLRPVQADDAVSAATPVAATNDPAPDPTAPAVEPTPPPFYPIVGSSLSEDGADATIVHDGDPNTYWLTDAMTPPEAVLTLDVGDVRAISAIRWLLATTGTLSTLEIQLSEDGATWASLVTLDGASMQAGVWIEQPVDVWARYVRFIAHNPDGLPQLGGLAEVEVWPATEARPLAAIVANEPPPPATGQGVIVGTGGESANCRIAPDLNAEVIALLAEGTVVDTTGEPLGDWQPVLCEGQSGYVNTQFIQGTDVTVATATDAATPPASPQAPSTADAAEPAAGTPADLTAAITVAGSTTFPIEADAHVEQDEPGVNFGSDTELVSDTDPARESYFRVNVAELSGPVESATLRVWVRSGTANGPSVALVRDTSWSESTITWNNRPAFDTVTDNKGKVPSNAYVEYDVTSFVTGGGSYTFALIPDSSDGLYFHSREAASNPPELVVISGDGTTPSGESATLLAAGDIARCSSDGDEQTATILEKQPGTVATLGDNAYGSGTSQQFAECYDPSWGAVKDRTRPSPGNHDYHTKGAAGYFDYFGVAAGDPSRGYYSYDLGTWHIVVLNSNIDMEAGSAQEQWLRNDLAANPVSCTLAYWHHPRFSSGAEHGNNVEAGPLFQALYDHGADVVLNGHEHVYERFAPQDPTAGADPEFGIREFVVGTGGASLYSFGSPQPNSEVRDSSTHGVLKVTLNPNGYSWHFLPVEGASFTDRGTGTCHDSPAAGASAPAARYLQERWSLPRSVKGAPHDRS